MTTVSEGDSTTKPAAFIGIGGQGGEGIRSRRRLSSDNKLELIQKALFRLRPLLVLMRLVDSIKQRWDAKRLGLPPTRDAPTMKHEDYMKRLMDEFLTQGSLQEVINECDDLFREYKDRMLRLGSVEEFLQDMGMLETIIQQSGAATSTEAALEKFILSHF